MAQQLINIGSAPNDGTGDKPRPAAIKINENFTELYTEIGSNLQSVQGGTNITIDNTDPRNPIINSSGGGSGTVESVTGDGVDNTDPNNPVLSFPTPGDIGADVAGAAAAVASNLSAHIADTTDAHAASAITNTASGNISATTVQAAINELDSEKQPVDATLTALAGLATGANKIPYSTGTDTFDQLDLDTDGTLSSNSDTKLASQKAVKTYTDAAIASGVAGLMDYRGVYDASVNAYPSSGGSGSAGAILKSDFWITSVAGTLPTGLVVAPGDLIIAKIDSPGNTQANWSLVEYNIGYTPVNRAGDTMGGNLAMGSNKVTGLAAASGNGEAVRYEQLPVASSESVAGLIEIATQAETTTGTDDLRAITPLKLATETRGVQDLFIPAAAMWPRVTGGCSALTQTEIATSLFNIQSLDFDQTTQEFAQCQLVLPRKWNNGTITAVVYWTAASGTGTVQWGISGGAYSDDDAMSTALGTAQTSDDTLITANDLHISPATAAITIAGTPADADFLAIQISRNPASDTLNADAKLLGVSFRITTDASKDA